MRQQLRGQCRLADQQAILDRVLDEHRTKPNEPSARLHRALGFEDAGLFREIGWKLGRWHDVHWMQKTLSAPGDA